MKKNIEAINIKKEVLKLKPISPKGYENLDLDRLVVYGLFMLEKKEIPLYADFICVGLFRLFPKKFSLANFSQYPDMFRTNNALRRTTGALSDQNKKRWVNGSPENGFSLTDFGREIANQVAQLIENPQLQKDQKKKNNTKSRGRSSINDVQETKGTEAFKKWRNGEDINSYEFFAFLKATPYTPKKLLAEHLKQLNISATMAKDKEVQAFLLLLDEKFKTLLQ